MPYPRVLSDVADQFAQALKGSFRKHTILFVGFSDEEYGLIRGRNVGINKAKWLLVPGSYTSCFVGAHVTLRDRTGRGSSASFIASIQQDRNNPKIL